MYVLLLASFLSSTVAIAKLGPCLCPVGQFRLDGLFITAAAAFFGWRWGWLLVISGLFCSQVCTFLSIWPNNNKQYKYMWPSYILVILVKCSRNLCLSLFLLQSQHDNIWAWGTRWAVCRDFFNILVINRSQKYDYLFFILSTNFPHTWRVICMPNVSGKI